MTEKLASAGQVAVTLGARERDFLVAMLNEEIGNVRVEVHRTHTPTAREKLLEREEVLKAILVKLD